MQLETVRIGVGDLATVQNLSYQWDRLANLTMREDLNLGKSESFLYDSLNRLVSARVSGLAAQTFAYDALGNITSKSDVGTYAYGDDAGPHAVTRTTGRLTQTYTYDANGNQIARFDALGLQKAVFTYSVFDKPTFLSTDGALHWSTFVYDENRDILVRRDSSMGAPSNGRTYFVEGLFEESIDPQGALERRHFVRGGDRTIAVVSDQGEGTALKTRYLHRDHLGSIDTITDETGSVVEELSYDAFGKRRNADWTPSVTRITSSLTKGYTGHESLDHLGLVHMGGRVYDPELGRFISADPFVQFPDSTQGLNRYAYVNNNPLTFVDPSGFGLSRFFKSVGKFFGKLLGAIGKVTKVINFIKSLACIASFGVGCLLAILQSAISVAFEFGLAPKTRFNTGRTGRLINGIGAALSAGGASQGAQKVTGIGGEVDIGVGMPSVFDQWTRSMRPDGVIAFNGEDRLSRPERSNFFAMLTVFVEEFGVVRGIVEAIQAKLEENERVAKDECAEDGFCITGGGEEFQAITPVGTVSRTVQGGRLLLVGVLRARGLSLSAAGLLKPGGRLIGEAGTRSSIRVVRGGADEAKALFEQLSAGGRIIEGAKFPGTLVDLPGVGRVGFRPVSTSGPPTIDVFIEGLGISKVKFTP